jgi:GNAT superfamily N-acetyltransferase
VSAPAFRRATAADIPAMSRIRLAVRENVLSNPARITEAMYVDYLEARGRGWVAEDRGEIIGFAYADRADGSIWALFVDPRREGEGVGTRLLRLAVDWLFEIGFGEIRLATQAHARADRFYAAQGWRREAMKDAVEVGYRLRRGD